MDGVTLTLYLFLFAHLGVMSVAFDYTGYELLSVYVRNTDDEIILSHLDEKYPELDFWTPLAHGNNLTVLVPPHLLQEFKSVAVEQGMPLTILADDVQSIVDAGSKRTPEAVVMAKNQASGRVIDHYDYHNYTEIRDYISKLAQKYPSHMEVSTLKYLTHEGRTVALVKLSLSPGSTKPIIILEAGIHAREWITNAVMLWFMEKLLRGYAAKKPGPVEMLDKFDWYLVPVLNPDGYEYTHSTYRFWRKNRRQVRKDCYGVDLNRNFDAAFATTSVSSNCNSSMYPGIAPFSEPETANVRELFNSLYNRVAGYVSVHTYSQMLLVPWGFTEYVTRPDNHVELDRVTQLMEKAISRKHGVKYTHGTATQLLGAVSGASEDWAMVNKPGIIALCIELRPDGVNASLNSFVLPPEDIIPVGQEFYAGIRVMAKEIKL